MTPKERADAAFKEFWLHSGIDFSLSSEAIRSLCEQISAAIAAAAADARRQAIEECLRLCENQPISPPYSPAVMRFQCADAIRALLPPAPEEGG